MEVMMEFEKRTIIMLVNNISKNFRDKMRIKCEELGLVDAYRPIFWVLKEHDGCTQLDICKLTQLKAPTVSLTLQKMETSGFIKRVVDEDDKRNVRIFITEKGNDIQNEIGRLLKETETDFLKDLDESEQEVLKKLLLKVIYSIGLECQCSKGDKK